MRINIIFLTLLLAFNTNAQDHLEPTNNLFSYFPYRVDYHLQITNILIDSLKTKPEIQVVILPSFSSEIVWQIFKTSDGRYISQVRKASKSIWHNQYEKKPKKIKPLISEKELSSDIYKLLKSLYLTSVYTTKYSLPDGKMGLDGTNYYFSVFDYGFKSGTIWSPKEGTLMRELVEITNILIQKFDSQESRIELEPEIIERIEDFNQEINTR
ncbi:MAG: hypothetical protein RLO17_10710 [Cyclobacteriaceae bacterium]